MFKLTTKECFLMHMASSKNSMLLKLSPIFFFTITIDVIIRCGVN